MKGLEIVGGGLAGLSLGIALRKQGVPVSLHEANTFPTHKVCGEFISGVSEQTLEELGLLEVFRTLPTNDKIAWYLEDSLLLERDLPEPAYTISRHFLDQHLSEYFQRLGGTLYTKSRYQASDREEGIIWANGRQKTGDKKWIGLKVHLTNYDLKRLEMHLGNNGYVGLVPIEDGRVNVCGLFQHDPSIKGTVFQMLQQYLKKGGSSNLEAQLSQSLYCEQSQKGVFAFSLGFNEHLENKVSVGDQVGIIPPFTGNGMSMALESSQHAINDLRRYSTGETAWNDCAINVHQKQLAAFQKRMILATTTQSLLNHSAGRTLMDKLIKVKLLPFNQLFKHTRT